MGTKTNMYMTYFIMKNVCVVDTKLYQFIQGTFENLDFGLEFVLNQALDDTRNDHTHNLLWTFHCGHFRHMFVVTEWSRKVNTKNKNKSEALIPILPNELCDIYSLSLEWHKIN